MASRPLEKLGNGALRLWVRKLGSAGSVAVLTAICVVVSILAVVIVRTLLFGQVTIRDIIVGITIPIILVPIASGFFIFLISDLDRMEVQLGDALERARRAETSARLATVGTLAAGIAHELNNPLAATRTRAHVIESLLRTESPDLKTISTQIQRVVALVDRMGKIVSGMLVLAHPSADLEPCNVREIFDQTVALFSGRAQNQKVDFRAIVKRDVSNVQATLSRSHFMHAISSLLSNAFEAVEDRPGGWVSISLEARDRVIRIEISNSGPRISSEVQSRMMDPFFTTKSVDRGAGLGLSIAKSMIAGMSGDLYFQAESEDTTFVIHLPMTAATKGSLASANFNTI